MVDTPHSRRMVTMDAYEWADLIDDADKVQMLIDPTSTYARAAAAAMGRPRKFLTLVLLTRLSHVTLLWVQTRLRRC